MGILHTLPEFMVWARIYAEHLSEACISRVQYTVIDVIEKILGGVSTGKNVSRKLPSPTT